MIYRIKIVKDGKFVRYATDEEMETLRPKADGTGVEQVSICDGLTNPINGEVTKYLHIEDVSDTHEVEWGFKHGEISCYHNDILESLVSLSSYDPKCTKYILEYDENTASFWIYSSNDTDIQVSVLCPGIDKMLLVIGNINENPELLEVQND